MACVGCSMRELRIKRRDYPRSALEEQHALHAYSFASEEVSLQSL